MQKPQLVNIQPKSILVVTLRYLGDTLLVTPLIHSLKLAYPDAKIDVLLPASNLGMLHGNPDIHQLIPMTEKREKLNFIKLLCGLFRRYDLAVSTQTGDRAVLCAVLAGKFSMGFVAGHSSKFSWKRLLFDRYMVEPFHPSHAVIENLKFCNILNIKRHYSLQQPRESLKKPDYQIVGKYAVLHIMPQWRYKQWNAENWIKVADFLNGLGVSIVLTGAGGHDELGELNKIKARLPDSTMNLAGMLNLGQVAALIEHAAIYIGVDTGITHLAAATGVLTVAIYGPTDPARWGPWPFGYDHDVNPFASVGTQYVNNVYLLQGASKNSCVPCQQEGCERNRQSYSACLDELPAEKVLEIISEIIQ